MKLFDYLLMIFIIILLFMAVSCTQAEDPCPNYEVEQFQREECTDDCVTIITTIEYSSK